MKQTIKQKVTRKLWQWGILGPKEVTPEMKKWGVMKIEELNKGLRYQIHENLRRTEWDGIKGTPKEDSYREHADLLQNEIERNNDSKNRLLYEEHIDKWNFYYMFGNDGQEV